jgi:hypothetical protein
VGALLTFCAKPHSWALPKNPLNFLSFWARCHSWALPHDSLFNRFCEAGLGIVRQTFTAEIAKSRQYKRPSKITLDVSRFPSYFITMNTGNTPEDILTELLPFLKLAYRVFEEAVPETLEEFQAKEEEIEPFHYASSVRFNAKRRLVKNKPSDLDFQLLDLLNNGLEAFYKGYDIKFYKGVNGSPPAAGRSKTRKAFYQQSLFGVGYEHEQAKRRVVVIWNCASKDRTFLGLDLTCPKGVIKDYEPPELYWSIPVPHPATVQDASNKYDSKPDELDNIKRNDEDEGDLDISLDGTDDQ